MEIIFKASALAVSAVIISLLIKRTNPEISIMLSLCTIAVIVFASIVMLEGIRDVRAWIERICGSSEFYIRPVIKCLGISLLTKFSSDMCRDCSHSSLASALEFCGAVSAFLLVSPMLINMLKTIGGVA